MNQLIVPEKLLGKFIIYCPKCGKGSQKVRKLYPKQKTCQNCDTKLSVYLVSYDGLVYPELPNKQRRTEV